VKIGKLVQSYIEEIFRCSDDSELINLMNKQYSKSTFGINFPFCAELENIPHVRYWKQIYDVRGKKLRVCSQWVEQSRDLFCRYIKSRNLTNQVISEPLQDPSGLPRIDNIRDRELDSQVIELLGHNRLTDELLRSGLEVAHPARDRGVDIIAYVDLETHVQSFVARPIQMKAASRQSFSIDRKYSKFPNLLIAFVWNLANGAEPVTFAMSYAEALRVGDSMGYTTTDSWQRGSYATTNPGSRLRELLEPYRMTSERWWERVAYGS
jgi:hypothetical protein